MNELPYSTLCLAAACAGMAVLLLIFYRWELRRLFGFAGHARRTLASNWNRPYRARHWTHGIPRLPKLPKFNFRSRYGGGWLMSPGSCAVAELTSAGERGVCPAFSLLSLLVAALFSRAIKAQDACAAPNSRGKARRDIRRQATGWRRFGRPDRRALRCGHSFAAPCLRWFCLWPAGRHAAPVNIALVKVGDVGNLPDPATSYGAVSYPYSIGEYDVTMGQYAAFLNAVATSGDTYGLWTTSMSNATPTYGITRTSTSAGYSYAAKGNSANVPVTYVSWGDAARFVNWLQNGEPTGPEGPGTTETGTYALNGSTGGAALMAVTRSTTATWVLPTVNEWNKAAYYVGGGTNAGYWLYPTQNNDPPSNVLSAAGTNNANFTASLGQPPVLTRSDPVDWLTAVGAFADSPGPYGTFDMGGDVDQWNETAYAGTGRGVYGASFAGTAGDLVSGDWGYAPPATIDEATGFRVAVVPEPNALSLVISVAVLFLLFRIVYSRTTARAMQCAGKGLGSFCACIGLTRKAKKTRAGTRGQWSGYRPLRFQCLEEKRMLSALYFDPGSSVMCTNGLLSINGNGTLINYNYLRFATITVTGLLKTTAWPLSRP